MTVKAILRRQIESFRILPFEHVENHTTKLFVRLFIWASALSYRILCIHFLYMFRYSYDSTK
jgi:hypothetical protein